MAIPAKPWKNHGITSGLVRHLMGYLMGYLMKQIPGLVNYRKTCELENTSIFAIENQFLPFSMAFLVNQRTQLPLKKSLCLNVDRGVNLFGKAGEFPSWKQLGDLGCQVHGKN